MIYVADFIYFCFYILVTKCSFEQCRIILDYWDFRISWGLLYGVHEDTKAEVAEEKISQVIRGHEEGGKKLQMSSGPPAAKSTASTLPLTVER